MSEEDKNDERIKLVWSKKNDPELSLAEGVAQAYERLSLFQKPLKITTL